ncbi:aldehyde dehydrogenase family protein [Sphingobacterium sp. Mn56C]|uniref:aldehyde dehydrogenase family protein n=1 Tax=Sphingobacterium sp. Mn56C TaxID=3395261 RepID=UPI003BBEAE16
MKVIDKIYIDGAFVTPHGTQVLDLYSPIDNTLAAQVRLGDERDVQHAVHAAQAAFKHFAKTSKAERITYLEKLRDAFIRRQQELIDVMVQEYGGTLQFCTMIIQFAAHDFNAMIDTLKDFELTRKIGTGTVHLQGVGVAGIIIPWNMSNGFIVTKVATAIAAGCTVVIKPSEMSAQQTQLIAEVFHEAGLPKGVINFVNGLGDVVGAEITRNPGISKISFTGSTGVGKLIAKGAVDTMKRVTLELGGKSPNIILPDADLESVLPVAVAAAFLNSGQACAAATRLLVPKEKLNEVNAIVKRIIDGTKVADPRDMDTQIGPMVSVKQFERVQEYIGIGIAEGAQLLAGGLGKPSGLEAGNFVQATVFTGVNNSMRIAQEEIFGPVLSIIPYDNEEDAIAIANDSPYGLAAYVASADQDHAYRVAAQLDAGRVCVNGLAHDSLLPFGGFKQSGIGREYGAFGLEAYLEPKAVLGLG